MAYIHHPLSGPSTSSAHLSGAGLGSYATEDPLEARVTNISMEIAAAIAQAQAEDRDNRRAESDEGLDSEEVDETGRRTQASGEVAVKPASQDEEGGEEDAEGEVDEDVGDEEVGGEDDDEFPEPLRARKGKEPEGIPEVELEASCDIEMTLE